MRVYRVSAPVCRECPAFGVCTKDRRKGRALHLGPHDAVSRQHRAWMETEEASKGVQAEKAVGRTGLRHHQGTAGSAEIPLRGLANVSAKWTTLATAFNLRAFWKVWRSRKPPFGELPFGLEPRPFSDLYPGPETNSQPSPIHCSLSASVRIDGRSLAEAPCHSTSLRQA